MRRRPQEGKHTRATRRKSQSRNHRRQMTSQQPWGGCTTDWKPRTMTQPPTRSPSTEPLGTHLALMKMIHKPQVEVTETKSRNAVNPVETVKCAKHQILYVRFPSRVTFASYLGALNYLNSEVERQPLARQSYFACITPPPTLNDDIVALGHCPGDSK